MARRETASFKFDYNGRQKKVSTASSPMEILLNGEAYQTPAGTSVADLVRHLGLPEDRVAVELDRRIVRRPQWGGTPLQTGAAVEIVQLVGGG